MSKKNAIALLCSDWHLSHRPPILRSEEPDWYASQQLVIDEVASIQDKHRCSIFFAGDLFHTWNSPPELINFVIDRLCRFELFIPGQHDMPNHNINEMHRSAYMVWARLNSSTFGWDRNVTYTLHPYGVPLKKRRGDWDVALVHTYCWNSSKNSFPGAPASGHVDKLRKALPNYTCIAVGDNHSHFIDMKKRPYIVNCGCMMRRSSTELAYEPSVTIWYEGDTFERVKLDTSKDKYLDEKYLKLVGRAEDVCKDAAALAHELETLGADIPDYFTLVDQILHSQDASKKVRQFTLRFLNDE